MPEGWGVRNIFLQKLQRCFLPLQCSRISLPPSLPLLSISLPSSPPLHHPCAPLLLPPSSKVQATAEELNPSYLQRSGQV
ncbi:hypothetical protein KCV06_g123, partial [Aureobasidium melanogenum]